MEFGVAVRFYVLASLRSPPSAPAPAPPSCADNSGPGEFLGDILQHPELVWSEDQWDEERYRRAEERLQQQQSQLVTSYWRDRYENKSKIYWHEFYKRNADHFYKDRHYLHLVFPELRPPPTSTASSPALHLLEVGCGVGNAVTPLLEIHPTLQVHAMDLAPSAIRILSSHPLMSSQRLFPSVCNVVTDDLPLTIPSEGVDLILCMFVLSAISPKFHSQVLSKLSNSLKPGGKILLRDYGRYDEAQLRFGKGSKIEDNFYVRQDGTCSYFFSTQDIAELAERVGGLEVEECYEIKRQYANRRQQQARYRVWIHAKLVKKNQS